MSKKRKKPSHLPALVSVTMVLLLLGLLGTLVILSDRYTEHLKENIVLTVYFTSAAPDERVDEITERITSMEFVRSFTFTSREQAAEDYQKDLGYDFEKNLGINPLMASIDISVKTEFTDSASIRRIKNEISGMDLIQDVRYLSGLVDDINNTKEKVSLILIGITIILVIISIILITNTVRLSVYANRFLVKSMQLVGATEWFIIRPFVRKAVFVGLLGGLFSIGLVLLAFFGGMNWLKRSDWFWQEFSSAYDSINGYSSSFSGQILTYWQYFLQDISQYSILFVSLLGLGIVILVISTYVSTKKYLKLKIDDLY